MDLGPVIGAAPSGSSGKPQPVNGRVLPQVRFQTENWDKMDLDLRYESNHILRPEALPIENLSVHALLDNGKLTLSPLKFGFAEGTLNIDARVDSHAKPVAAKLNGQVQSLKLSALFPKIEKMKKPGPGSMAQLPSPGKASHWPSGWPQAMARCGCMCAMALSARNCWTWQG